jgi:hypothetical protein
MGQSDVRNAPCQIYSIQGEMNQFNLPVIIKINLIKRNTKPNLFTIQLQPTKK